VEFTPPGSLTGQVRTYRWDAASRLREASTTQARIEYTYDPEGYRRSRKYVPAAEGEAEVETEVAYGLGKPVAKKEGASEAVLYAGLGPEASYAGGARVVRDAVGSHVALSGGGPFPTRWKYTPWGEYREDPQHAGAPAGGVTPGFGGHEWDPGAGLVYAQQRWYEPSTGRFASRDPAEGKPGFPATTNPYLYAAGNPTAFVDPDGAEPVTLFLMGVAASALLNVAMDAGIACLGDAVETGEWGGCGAAASSAAVVTS
jgi:RHS repeat-associated protein